MLAQLGAHAGQQHGELERLQDIVIGTRIEPQDLIGIGRIPGQHHDRRLEAALAQLLDGLAAIHVRQANVEHDEVEMAALGELDTFSGCIGLSDLEFIVQHQLISE